MAKEAEFIGTYSVEKKQWIMERLNAERKERQKYEEERTKVSDASEKKDQEPLSEKEKILARIDKERRIAQKYKELQKRQLKNKKIYTLENRTLYKIFLANKEYYIDVDDCKRLSSTPGIFPVFYLRYGGLKKKEALIRIKEYTDNIFISEDVLRVYFKPSSLEDERK
ncbi:MAG: hypothetical protein ABXS92_07775 [Sulfurimonas sp.]